MVTAPSPARGNPPLERSELRAEGGVVDQAHPASQQHRQGVQIVFRCGAFAGHESDAMSLPLVGMEAAGKPITSNFGDMELPQQFRVLGDHLLLSGRVRKTSVQVIIARAR